MLAENSFPKYSGALDKELHLPATCKHQLTGFIENHLTEWRDDPCRPDKVGETVLTEHLCEYLNSAVYYSEDWSHIQFRTETTDETHGGRKIDLTAKPRAAKIFIEGRRHTQYDSLFPIECKRLPTPKQHGRDEREYVITAQGTTGGIQRFKFGHHGSAHEFAAIVGYIQERDAKHWFKAINDWIRDLALLENSEWSCSDCLEGLDTEFVKEVSSFHSSHVRANNLEPCSIKHLWIQM